MTASGIPGLLRELRIANCFTVDDVAEYLSNTVKRVSAKTIYGWENGVSTPSVPLFLTLCEMYGVRDISIFLDTISSHAEDTSAEAGTTPAQSESSADAGTAPAQPGRTGAAVDAASADGSSQGTPPKISEAFGPASSGIGGTSTYFLTPKEARLIEKYRNNNYLKPIIHQIYGLE
ncbi:MAG: hypothetical protein J6P16_03085 [Eubacterium sp.]|nr:hypothetical protein [Eubacterium sp.]